MLQRVRTGMAVSALTFTAIVAPSRAMDAQVPSGPRYTAADVQFMQGMIAHHAQALAMVAKLFDSAGAGQTPEVFGYATGVDADQRAEIVRMQGMLTALPR